MAETLQDIQEDFDLFDTWEDRYRYLIDLGRALPAMDEALKTDEALVKGCTSRVWLIVTLDERGGFRFLVDSDAHIVRGLAALLVKVYEGKTPQDASGIDIEAFFDTLGLSEHLSPNRRSGFFSMVERVRSYCAV